MLNKIKIEFRRLNPIIFVYFLAVASIFTIYFMSAVFTGPGKPAIEIESIDLRVTNLQSGESTPWTKSQFPLAAIHPWSKDPERYEIHFGFDAKDFDSQKLYFFAPRFSHGGNIYLNGKLLETTSDPETTTKIKHTFHPLAADLNAGELKAGYNEIVLDTITQDTVTAIAGTVWIGPIDTIKQAFFSQLDATHTLRVLSISLLMIVAIFSMVILMTERGEGANRAKQIGAQRLVYISVGIFLYMEFFFPESFPSRLLWLLTIIQFVTMTAVMASLFYGWMMLAQVHLPRKLQLVFIVPPALMLLTTLSNPALKFMGISLLSGYLFLLYLIPGGLIFKRLISSKSLSDRLSFLGALTFYVSLLPVVIHDFLVITDNIVPLHSFLTNTIGIPEFWASSTLRIVYVVPPIIISFMAYILIELVKYGHLQRRQNEILEERVKKREAELLDSYEKIRVQEVHIVQLNERSRIMRDIHDVLGSILTIGSVRSRSPGFSVEMAGELFKRAIDELRLILNGFSGDKILLEKALDTLIEQTQRTVHDEIAILFSAEGVIPDIGYDKTMNILRVVQESITNIIKHSKATKCVVSMTVEDKNLVIDISDDGKQFDYEQSLADTKGRGLPNINKRMSDIGATVQYRRINNINHVTLTSPYP